MKKLKRDKRNIGWKIDAKIVEQICEDAFDRGEIITVEETEAIMLAMVEFGYAELEEKE